RRGGRGNCSNPASKSGARTLVWSKGHLSQPTRGIKVLLRVCKRNHLAAVSRHAVALRFRSRVLGVLSAREPQIRPVGDGECDLHNFLSCLERIVPEASWAREESHNIVTMDNRRTRVATFPISISFEEFAGHAASRDVEALSTQLRRELTNNFIVLGVDRMDYTKGIPERLKAFRILLRRFPELRHKVTLLQVVVPSREEIPNYKE